MHMGYTGPRRVAYDAEGFAPQPPARLEDNPHTILDVADIVYIDPVATGFSRMAPGEDPHKYHGVMEDIQSVGEFVRLFVTRNERWGSPKFIIGESYGTTRASGLAGYLLSRHRMYVNGVILVSMTNLDVNAGTELSSALVLPHYTATAWYHKQLPADLQSKPLRSVLDEAEAFALDGYLRALVKGHDLPAAEKADVVKRLSHYTSLSPTYIEQSNLRISLPRFRKELLRHKRLTVGRLDSRYIGVDRDAVGDTHEFDPAMSNWNGPFTDAVTRYLQEELGYKTDLEYNVWGDVRPWKRDPSANVGQMLRRAMTENPYLKVMVQAGYFDGGTDYFSARYTISQLQPGGELKDRFRFAYYESGHMMYLRKEDLANAKRDLADFIRWALEEPARRPGTPVALGQGEVGAVPSKR
jgi:carboxypeptidase C (cathepsin A)